MANDVMQVCEGFAKSIIGPILDSKEEELNLLKRMLGIRRGDDDLGASNKRHKIDPKDRSLLKQML